MLPKHQGVKDLQSSQLTGEKAVAPKGHYFKILCYLSHPKDELGQQLLEMVAWSIRGFRKP